MKHSWSGWGSCSEYNSGGDKKTKFYCAKAKRLGEMVVRWASMSKECMWDLGLSKEP